MSPLLIWGIFFAIVQTGRIRPTLVAARAEGEAWRRVAEAYLLHLRQVEEELEDLRREQEDQQNVLSRDMICTVCLVATRNALLVPCYHLVTCINCASMMDTCPVCRQHINERTRVYVWECKNVYLCICIQKYKICITHPLRMRKKGKNTYFFRHLRVLFQEPLS